MQLHWPRCDEALKPRNQIRILQVDQMVNGHLAEITPQTENAPRASSDPPVRVLRQRPQPIKNLAARGAGSKRGGHLPGGLPLYGQLRCHALE